MNFMDKKVLVVGLATSGVPTVNTLIDLGCHVTVNDMKTKEQLREILEKLENKDIEYILGKHPSIDRPKFDYIILSPGVPTDLSFIKEAKKQGIVVMGELELAYQLCKGSFIAITGTNGKTTTTALTGEMFKNAMLETYVVGNIGVAAISKALVATENAHMITEVSSFQLESIIDFKPKIAAVLNITPDHLNRHKTMENYVNSKANIFKYQEQEDFLILNVDNDLTYGFRNKSKSKIILFSRKRELDPGVFVLNNNIVFKSNEEQEIICSIDEIKIPGAHNLENALAAVAMAKCAGIDKEVIARTLKEFGGVEHRLELVEEIEGIRFINDSKGTNPDASIKAIEAMKTPVILIAGGMDKGSEFNEFINAFNGKVKHMVLIGETADKIENTAEKNGFYNCNKVDNMEEAVNKAYNLASSGDTILLSPACASWDMYPNFEVRGKHFKSSVEKLRRP